MIINASYLGLPVGTAAYTDNLVTALPQARTVRLPAALLRSTASAFWTKRLAELASSIVPADVIHPFWATSISSHHVVSALDLVQFREGTSIERRLLRAAGHRAKAVLVLSQAMAPEIASELDRDVVVAPPFAGGEWYESESAPLPAPAGDGRVRIAYWGGWHERKGMTAFLDRLARSSISSDVEVHCTGRPPFAPKLKVVVHDGMGTHDLVEMVDGCHLSVYPSDEEGFGLPVLESLLRRRPVVCRPLPVYDEFSSGHGRVHPADWETPEEIEAAILSALQLPAFSPNEALVKPLREDSVSELRSAVMMALREQP